MSIIQNNLLMTPEGYQISRSVRLRSSASAYFNRTPAGAGNRQKFTISVWYKASGISSGAVNANIINAGGDGSSLLISGTGAFGATYDNRLLFREAGTTLFYWPMVFRDASAWYHIVFAMDTTQATAANRAKLYVNGVDQGAFSGTAITQNTSTSINNTSAHYINTFNGTNYPSDLYYTEYNLIDGQALTPSSFGETDSITGVWKPKKYTGTYGTNGFFLNFSDNSNNTATTIGKDYSGNGNNWTPNNISVTSGVTYDSMLDVPTQWADGGNGRGNYAVLNAVASYSGLPLTAANIQTSAVASGGNWYSRSATMGISSGKWYAEFSMPSISSGAQGNPVGVGIIPASNDFSAAGQLVGNSGLGYGFYCPDTTGSAPTKRVSGSNTSVGTGSATATTDVFMVAFDLTNGNAWFGKNGTWYAGDPSAGTGASITGITASEYVFGVSVYRDNTFTNNTVAINFGQRPFAYTPPTGFKALNTLNLPTPTILKGNQFFDVALQTGNTTGRTVSGLAFQPDLVWVKNRAGSTNRRWGVIDSVRGVNKTLSTALTDAEVTSQTDLLTAFNSDGFTIGADAGFYGWNGFAESYAHFVWKESATAGFDIVTYTFSTAGTNTINHSLGVAPKFIIMKDRSFAYNWDVYHASVGYTQRLVLNSTAAAASGFWAAAPTSTQFSVTSAAYNNNDLVVAYCFAEVAGFSRFGSYTGNGSTDGPFVFTGFRPRWVMVKRTDTSGNNWVIIDTARDTYNAGGLYLYPNLSAAEDDYRSSTGPIDVLSNGFKPRSSLSNVNASGATYIFMALAENPFKHSLAR